MPLPDCACKVINGDTGYVRDNTSWVIGRIVRDYESWMDNGQANGPIKSHLKTMIDNRWHFEQLQAENKEQGSGRLVEKPKQASLCVSVFKAGLAVKGQPGKDLVYYLGFATSIVQLGIAAIPAGIFGDWSIFLITIAGILLSFITGSLPQWKQEKWACRDHSEKRVVLTRGNGSQHAIVILGNGKGLDMEDLAAGQTNVDVSTSWLTRICVIVLATFWILLLITAAGIKQNTWFLLAIGAIGIFQNICVAGWRRVPHAYGIPLEFVEVIGAEKVMKTLFEVEDKYPRIGASMVSIFFPGKLFPAERLQWEEYDRTAKQRQKALLAPRDPAPAPAPAQFTANGVNDPVSQAPAVQPQVTNGGNAPVASSVSGANPPAVQNTNP
jgi:hypothetical protein